MLVAENTKYSVFFLNEIIIPRKTYSPTTIFSDKAVKLQLLNKKDMPCIPASEPEAPTYQWTNATMFLNTIEPLRNNSRK